MKWEENKSKRKASCSTLFQMRVSKPDSELGRGAKALGHKKREFPEATQRPRSPFPWHRNAHSHMRTQNLAYA